MTRIPILAANWKMNNNLAESLALVDALCGPLAGQSGVEVVLCPPFIALAAAAERLKGTRIALGAQNMHWADKGAYTGEISPLMLAGLARYVIVGHSERRQFFGETDETVAKKVRTALAHGLTPIVCVGENLTQYEAGETSAVVGGQVRAALRGLTAEEAGRIVIAYEPVWAIGTGRAASGAGANAVIGLTIRGAVSDLFGEACARRVRVQYGGSVTPANIVEFMQQPDIDGALVGGASLKAHDFLQIISESVRAKNL
ncbi:MAG: triose-phosphate isomerase [Chloroflexi bacterium]|nr:triose-phosphate isomerase [Chloroflexota bacterium]